MITRGGLLARVLEGIASAQGDWFLVIKLNAVALKGPSRKDGIDDLIGFAHAGGMTLTLIQTMPLGEIGADRTDQFLPALLAASPDRAALDLGSIWPSEPADRRATSCAIRNRREDRFSSRP